MNSSFDSTIMAASPLSPKSTVLSPVKLAESPSQTQKGNLTGTPRKVKDTIADIYNLIQRWNRLHADGATLLRDISEQLPRRLEEEKNGTIWEALQKKCAILEEIKNKQSDIVSNLDKLRGHFLALDKLTKAKFEPVFITWPMSHYVLLSEKILNAYRQQFSINKYVVENVALNQRHEAEALISLWIHQTYLEATLNFQVEAALRETGFS